MMVFQDILESLRHDDLDWMKLNLNETASSVIIESALTDVQRMADEKDITLQVNNHYNGNLNVEAGIFPQVLKNLLSNSIKFSHPGFIVNLDVRKPNGVRRSWESNPMRSFFSSRRPFNFIMVSCTFCISMPASS